jgi:hypothetical protein
MRVDWTPAGSTALRLDENGGWTLLQIGGHGAPDTVVHTLGTPDRDERLPLHAAAQPRIVRLTFLIQGTTPATFETNREMLVTAFAPWRDASASGRPGLLSVTLTDGRVRTLRAFPREGLAWTSGRRRGNQTVESIVLEAPDPFWFDPTPASGNAAVQAAGSLRFDGDTELGFPAAFGSDLPNASTTITNPGSARSFPVIEVAGPVVNPSLRLASSGHVLAFDLTVPTGLSLRVTNGAQPDGSVDAPGAALIDDLGGESNVLGTLRTGSRFWALGPGDNRVVFAQDSPSTGTVYQYQFFPRDVAI